MQQNSITKLELLEDEWMNREEYNDGYLRNSWLEEGIELYRQFHQLDKKEPRYSISLANLYLELGRDEKMRLGNYRRAYEILRRATIYAPDKPDGFYHLSFILAEENRKWEAELFYGKEALDKGIDESKKLKLLCNMALGYSRIGYPKKAMECIKEATRLDVKKENAWFIQLYQDKMKLNVKEPILLKKSDEDRESISEWDTTKLRDDAMDGKCVVLDLSKDEKHFYGIRDTVRLEKKEGEILGFIIDQQMTSCPRNRIEEAVWFDQAVSRSAVRRYITRLRDHLADAMDLNRDEIKNNILVTTQDGYAWKANIPSYVLR